MSTQSTIERTTSDPRSEPVAEPDTGDDQPEVAAANTGFLSPLLVERFRPDLFGI